MIVTGQVPAATADQVLAQLIPGGVWLRSRYYPPIAGGAPDDGEPAGAPPATPPAAPPATPPATPPEPFDRDRAVATIQKLRGFERLSKDQAKELDDLRAKVKAAEDEKLSDTERLQKRVTELEPSAAQVQRYEAALKKHLDAARKDLPEHITALLDKLPVDEQLDWIAANQDALKVTSGSAGGTAPINPPPRSNGQTVTREAQVDDTLKEMQVRYRLP